MSTTGWVPVSIFGNQIRLEGWNGPDFCKNIASVKRIEFVRGVFLEGKPIYETSGFFERTHIQICVRDLRNIKAVFRVPPAHLKAS
jgi:hypothetical protein